MRSPLVRDRDGTPNVTQEIQAAVVRTRRSARGRCCKVELVNARLAALLWRARRRQTRCVLAVTPLAVALRSAPNPPRKAIPISEPNAPVRESRIIQPRFRRVASSLSLE